MRARGKLDKFERELRRKMPQLPILAVQQSLEDENSFTDLHGNTYTAEDLEDLSETHTLLMLVYGERKGEPQAGKQRISLSWGDDKEEGHL